MSAKRSSTQGESGFTLIETIITICMIAFAAAITFQFMYTPLISGRPSNIVNSEIIMGRALEEVTSDYMQRANSYATAGSEPTVNAFLNSISTAVTPTGLSVTKDVVCFTVNGDLGAACSAEQIPLLRVRVQENLADFGGIAGRIYTTLYGKTRVYTDPTREH